jgi:Na+/melibiose symporter-like transporter
MTVRTVTTAATVSVPTKLAYGVGQAAEAIKNSSFELFLFFYYTQVLGLSGTLAGAALFIALCVDGITDPVIGSLSDGWRSRWGRRHPFMYVSAIPLALSFYWLFAPPGGLGQFGLFAWLSGFAVLVRFCMTLYQVPHLGLAARQRRPGIADHTGAGVFRRRPGSGTAAGGRRLDDRRYQRRS